MPLTIWPVLIGIFFFRRFPSVWTTKFTQYWASAGRSEGKNKQIISELRKLYKLYFNHKTSSWSQKMSKLESNHHHLNQRVALGSSLKRGDLLPNRSWIEWWKDSFSIIISNEKGNAQNPLQKENPPPNHHEWGEGYCRQLKALDKSIRTNLPLLVNLKRRMIVDDRTWQHITWVTQERVMALNTDILFNSS